ncbi:MAG: ferredoxin [Bacteroidetes bacterium RIFOXYA12_FULL_35_11]|nr:MAG: ferredoxin [Bacteroidetes bacterium GWF2_35_48]OFY82702.1 MAG: ferredoxin [Bacteroidetes bacterium RIFOXYA12_FULL_35_11]OFY93504.1 MAG: ferredoxin [Bacteroidetes bacterium RIFOXYB2_FULL_35_7]OFY95030.1 MAG: ferredoxin [Bacteroidetes bacterium RIFOXYC12_FULL_35_7]HBX51804.1 ferredoxin [Bacteroidales bacterium]
MEHRYLKNVVTLKLDVEKCNGCKMCMIVCPHNVFIVEERKAIILNKDLCMECGACAKNCAQEAISVKPGVGCAAGILMGMLKGTEPTCDCTSDSGSSCC